MKPSIFTTRQRAAEILKEAINIWANTGNSEHLEGLEKDPVFSMFITALAYQSNEIDNEIEQLKTEILDEFSRMLVPANLLHAIPATAVVELVPEENIPVQQVDHRTGFSLSETPYPFIPLLKTKVFNASVHSIVRLDGRRWKVTLQFKDPAANLSGMTFMIGNTEFQDLKVFADGYALPVIKPWEYADAPFDDCFSIENMLYARTAEYQSWNTWFDCFAKNNVRLFYIDNYKTASTVPYATDKTELIFEFFGINEKFTFDKKQLFLNCTILVNAKKKSATLSANTPIVNLTEEKDTSAKWQFLHVIRPPETQLYNNEPVEIRKIATERFNPDNLVKLATTLISRFSSDYYAFQNTEPFTDEHFMDKFYLLLKKMSEGIAKASRKTTPGLYLMLKNNTPLQQHKDTSLNIDYLITNGASINTRLNGKSKITASSGSNIKTVNIVADPLPGHDEIQEMDSENNLARYYMVTNDRIVTPADIKMLCYNELATRYGITGDMITQLKVRNIRNAGSRRCGYETQVYITISDNPFVKRNFQDKIPMTELVLQKMIEVRSTSILPVQVTIEIN